MFVIRCYAADSRLQVATIQTLNPCGAGSSGVAQATFPILKGETKVDIRVLVDRSIIEVFIMGGRVVFTKGYNPGIFYVRIPRSRGLYPCLLATR